MTDNGDEILSVFFFLVFTDTTDFSERLDGGRLEGSQQVERLVRQDDIRRYGL